MSLMHSTGEVVCGKCGWWTRAEQSEELEGALLSHVVSAHPEHLLLYLEQRQPHETFSEFDRAMLQAYRITY